jgi:hypothetical protein
MSRRGTLYAITPDEASRLLSLAGNDAAVAKEAIDLFSIERSKARMICALDTGWELLHRCLTDGTTRDKGAGTTPRSWCVLGGQSLHGGDGTIVCFVTSERVGQVSAPLDEIQPNAMYQRFVTVRSNQSENTSMEDFEYAWEIFTNVRNLYSKATSDGRSMVFVAD